MPETDSDRGTAAGDADSRRGLWLAMRRFFEGQGGERSLRRELEDKINEHEGDEAASGEAPGAGDLSREEREMLRNFEFFGAPHLAVVHTPSELGTYGAIDCGLWIDSFLLARAHRLETVECGLRERAAGGGLSQLLVEAGGGAHRQVRAQLGRGAEP